MKGRLPLKGVRVADLSVVLAGPGVTSLLADWGAEVIRIEPLQVLQPSTRGRSAFPSQASIDAARNWVFAYPNWTPGERAWNKWPFYQAHAKNKLSMTVDTKQSEGIDIIKRLIAVSDIVVENNVPETIAKLGLGYEVIRQIKPDIIMLRMPAYGLTGPYENFRSFGPHLEGTAGHTNIRGYSDTDASMTEDVFFGDACAAATGAFAAATAMYQARRTGKGQLVELAQVESLVPFFGEFLMDYQMNGRVPGPQGNDLYTMAPHNAYQCLGEDSWVAIAVSDEKEWQGLLRAMGSPDWARDERFFTQAARFTNREALDTLVTEWTLKHENRWVMVTLQEEDVPAGVLNNEEDAFNDPQLNARGFFPELNHPDIGVHRYPGIVWKMSKTPNAVRSHPVTLGEHNAYVYKELLSISDAEFVRLENEGHISDVFPRHVG
ncbi:CoA transferase [Dehalococcoidia bacterium]|nr:CoA transferase [Dehalococcoidia bacterium]